MSTETKIFSAIIGATILLIGGASFLLTREGSIDQTSLVRAESHIKGPDNSKVTVVEFSDFECPACKLAQPVVQEVLTKYGNQINFVYRHFPLPSHQYAMISAQAAEAAGLQGKFWEMHDLLFDKSPDLSKDKLLEYAQQLGLNMEQFTRDLDSDVVLQKVLNDQADGNKVAINATPTFFVNGVKISGAPSFSQFQQQIDPKLR